jgi:NADPH:quinone reductase
MKAWLVKELCKPDAMVWADIKEPTAGPNQVKVRVAASGLNFLDTLMIEGRYQVKPALPFTPGVEISGTVIARGEGSRFSVGDRVCATLPSGGFAEIAVADDVETQKIPDTMDFADGVAIRVAYPTAYAALRLRANAQAGETILVHAGAGGTGVASIQIAKAMGCRVIATAGGPDKVAICKKQGADAAIDYNDGDWLGVVRREAGAHGIDVVIDPVGGSITENSVRCLAWNGRLVVIGFAGGTIASVATNRLLLRNASVCGVYWGAYAKHEPMQLELVFTAIFDMWRQGKIKPVVSERLPMQEAPIAMQRLASRQTHGKVVLVP